MPKVTIDVTVDKIKKLRPQLSAKQIFGLDHEIHDYLEPYMMMTAAQASFAEW